MSIEFFGGKYEEEYDENFPIKDEFAIKEENENDLDRVYIDEPEVSIDEIGTYDNSEYKEEQGMQFETGKLPLICRT